MKMPDVLITPHLAGVSEMRGDRQNALIGSNIERFAKGLERKNRVSAKGGD